MQYSHLGQTEIEVSRICLGTMTWGEQNSEQEAHAQLDAALDAGINFIDTAEMYPTPPRAETYGTTERYIGNWLKARGCRDRVVLASKVMGPAKSLRYVRDGEARLDHRNIEAAIDLSLQRLRTDYIDLYQLHWPDRKTNYFGQREYRHDPDDQPAPIEETLDALDALVRSGKIRQVGVSNETPWGLMKFLHLSEVRSQPRMVSIQNPYNLLNRLFEVGLAEVAHREGVGLLAYSPLAFGALTGKYLGGARPEGARVTRFKAFNRYTGNLAQKPTRAYVDLAHKHGLDPARMALAYVHSRAFVTSTIIGATTLQQLHDNLASIDITLSDEILEGIESIHDAQPNPCP